MDFESLSYHLWDQILKLEQLWHPLQLLFIKCLLEVFSIYCAAIFPLDARGTRDTDHVTSPRYLPVECLGKQGLVSPCIHYLFFTAKSWDSVKYLLFFPHRIMLQHLRWCKDSCCFSLLSRQDHRHEPEHLTVFAFYETQVLILH